MIHLAYASLDLTTMMRSVRFPIQAGRAPNRATICLADKCIPTVEVLQARRRLCSRRRCGCLTSITRAPKASVLPATILQRTSVRTSAAPFPIALFMLSFLFCFALFKSAPLTAAGNISGIDGNGIQEPGISEGEEGEKEGVQYKDANRWARASSFAVGGRSEEVVHC